MTIVYVDLTSGNDSTGDGTYGNPYLTINKADDGLTGGDEVRVALTTINTLSGTLSFTNQSASVGTSVDLTGSVSADDVIGKSTWATDGWWRVASLTSTTITLEAVYVGTTDADATGYHIVPETPATYQSNSTAGSSSSSRLKITGGWDLSTQTRTGITCYNGGGSTSGAYRTFAGYVELGYFVFLHTYDYSGCFQFVNDGCYGHDLHIAADKDCGKFYVTGDSCILEDCTHTGLDDDEQCQWSGNYGEITRCYALAPGDQGFYIMQCGFVLMTDCVVKGDSGNSTTGIYLYQANKIKMVSPTIDYCTNGIHSYSHSQHGSVYQPDISNCTNAIWNQGAFLPIYVYDPTFASNTNDLVRDTGAPYGACRFAVYDSGWYSVFPFLTVEADTVGARSGTCVKLSPSTTFLYNQAEIPIAVYKVDSAASDIDLNVYIKDDASFNGSIVLEAVSKAKRLGILTEPTLTTSYVQQTITVSSSDLVVDDYITLYAHVVGTAGSVYIDDFSVS